MPIDMSLFPKINEKRIITMTRSGDKKDWRGNLSRLLEDQKRRQKGDISTMFNPSAEWTVKSSVYLLMTENKPIKITNTPDNPLAGLKKGFSNKSIIGKIGNIFTAGIGLASAWGAAGEGGKTAGKFDPWITELKTWKQGRPISLELSLDFAMGQYGLWSAWEEVVKPIMNLLAPVLPQYMNEWMQYGAFPTTLQFIAGLIKDIFVDQINEEASETGDSSSENSNDELKEDAITTDTLNKLAEKLESYVLTEYKKFTYDIRFGNTFTFYKMLPVSASTKFSNEVDQDGYPISGNITITFEGLMPNTLTSKTGTERAAKFGTLDWNMAGSGEDEDHIEDKDYY